MAEQGPQNTPDFWSSIGVLVGGGGIGAVILELIRRIVPTKKGKEDITESYVEKLRADLERTQQRFTESEARWQVHRDALEDELARERATNMLQLRANVELETENRLLRSRYHRIRSYCQMLLLRLETTLGTIGMTEIPIWVDEEVPGPTMQARALPEGHRDG